MQKRANHDLKLQKKRQNDDQIKIELDIKSKYSHIEQTIAKLSVQNEEIRNMKELVKIFLLKKSGLKLSDLQSMKESPSSSDIAKQAPPTSSSENDQMGSMKPTPPEDQESVPLAKNHPYARMSYADTIKRVISEKVQMNYIVNKYKEAMSKDLIVKKPLNRPEINVSRLKTRIDQTGKLNG